MAKTNAPDPVFMASLAAHNPEEYFRRVRNMPATEVLIYEFEGSTPAPERVVRLARGLGQHFPKARLTITTDGQLRVFAKEKDTQKLALMRAFCAGFAVSL